MYSQTLERALASYVPRPVMSALYAGKDGLIGELRQVTILFISLPDFGYETSEQIERNQQAFIVIQKAIARFDGILR